MHQLTLVSGVVLMLFSRAGFAGQGCFSHNLEIQVCEGNNILLRNEQLSETALLLTTKKYVKNTLNCRNEASNTSRSRQKVKTSRRPSLIYASSRG